MPPVGYNLPLSRNMLIISPSRMIEECNRRGNHAAGTLHLRAKPHYLYKSGLYGHPAGTTCRAVLKCADPARFSTRDPARADEETGKATGTPRGAVAVGSGSSQWRHLLDSRPRWLSSVVGHQGRICKGAPAQVGRRRPASRSDGVRGISKFRVGVLKFLKCGFPCTRTAPPMPAASPHGTAPCRSGRGKRLLAQGEPFRDHTRVSVCTGIRYSEPQR